MEGEVIGAGIDYLTSEVFFTRNGEIITGEKNKLKLGEWPYHHHPTVGLGSKGAKLSVNFGSAPFMFNLCEYQSERRLQARIRGETLPEWIPMSQWSTLLIILVSLFYGGLSLSQSIDGLTFSHNQLLASSEFLS